MTSDVNRKPGVRTWPEPVTAEAVLAFLEDVASGRANVGTDYAWTHRNMAPYRPATMSPEDEVRVWQAYRRCAAGFEASAWCRRRRLLLGMFFLVDFRSRDAEEAFKRSVGMVSMKELMTFCGRRLPHFYYEWAFDVLPLSKKSFGVHALKGFRLSPDHVRTFKKLEQCKKDLYVAKAVQES